MKKKIVVLISVVAVLCFTFIACSNHSDTTKSQTNISANNSSSLVRSYDNLKDLKKASEIIIEAEVTNDQKSFEYEHVTFTSSKVKVLKVHKGNVKESDILNILESGGISKDGFEISQDGVSVIKPSEHYLLFLYKYIGPVVTETNYQALGCYQGKFKIEKDNKVKQTAPDAAKTKDIENDILLDELVTKMKDTKED
ncbi:hypothetical protein [Pseudobacteroides cellulosolvens]|uniref:Lipoprotein n=1 Tax=Pseudobacteroides cellulosolvens ATCC 35603 = DSM 2933 TaxID=398512 RepID=A0A0L6JYB4_9FIRM|nr:hypothetical protein [Pseudobacteroides cellulosolvens]KNY30523.1 hypothetical protein Bccel_5803 [Pseudobacteroides cellulosolvens ATCC 35603 = DSM 2933]KNY30530.1 hypothetical protein Bccel_5810 [Pseudobacteroides cellulosolvens ATCC 35603 = DSM 2933]